MNAMQGMGVAFLILMMLWCVTSYREWYTRRERVDGYDVLTIVAYAVCAAVCFFLGRFGW